MNISSGPEAQESPAISRRKFLQFLGGSVLGTIALLGGGYTYVKRVETRWFETTHHELSLPRLAAVWDGFRIAHLTDIHLSESMTGAQVAEAVSLVLAQAPDLVAITGDFIDFDYGVQQPKDALMRSLSEALSPLAQHAQVMAVLGNHDYALDADLIREILYRSGIQELCNDVITLRRQERRLHVAGIDDLLAGQPDLNRVVEKIPSDGEAALVLMHEPDFADSVRLSGRFDFQLSGHSHGGQVVIPFVGPLVLPEYGRKYPSGFYQVGDVRLYTNRGLGTVHPRVRFNCRPEVAIFTLRSGNVKDSG